MDCFHVEVNFLEMLWNLVNSVSDGIRNDRFQNDVVVLTEVLPIIFLFSYKEVCNACSLDDDLKQMPSGDLTEVKLLDYIDSLFFQES